MLTVFDIIIGQFVECLFILDFDFFFQLNQILIIRSQLDHDWANVGANHSKLRHNIELIIGLLGRVYLSDLKSVNAFLLK